MCHRKGGNAMRENFKNSNLMEQPPMGDYILRSKLGESSLSTVWKAEHRTSGEAVALKQIPLAKLTSHLRNCLECELTFLSSVNHPNIIRLLDFFKCEGFIILVLEFCAGGNLASFIWRHGRVQECRAKRFMQQLGAGLKVLTQNHIVHRDLKPENILLSGSECNPVLKIADFGLSRILLPDESAETVCGSPFYMAPEILQFQRYDEKVDMWSVGAILFELLNGYPPFHGRTSVQLLQNIKESTSLPFSHLIIPQLHPDCIDLCSRLLSIYPGLSNFTNNRASPHHTYGPQNSLNMLNHSLTSWRSLQVIVCPMRSFISTNFYKFEVGAISRC